MTMQAAITPRKGERGAALVVAILVLAILTVIGIALMLITSTESRIAANEWSINRGFYAAAVTRLMTLFSLPARAEVVACRGTGEPTCMMKVAMSGADSV